MFEVFVIKDTSQSQNYQFIGLLIEAKMTVVGFAKQKGTGDGQAPLAFS